MKKYFYYFLFFFLVLIDQLSKFWASSMGFVTENGGVSFGLMNGFGGEIYVQLILLLVLFYILHKSIMPALLKTFFLSGVVSNTIDRLFLGGVVQDWLPIPLVGIRNNFADWFIFLAIVLYVIKYGYEYRNNLRR
ncbi:MAG: signal peptidase II [Candidatus Pacebacteria bacterium]|nr:signal peptidase II [Candidatus Paceibacterota bacterium]